MKFRFVLFVMFKSSLNIVFIFSLIALIGSLDAFAQEETIDVDRLFEVNYESPLTIDLGEDEEDDDEEKGEPKKKKRKRKVFYKVKTKKGFTRTGFGQDVVVELFHYLKVYEEPDSYVRDIFWYDFKKRKITNSRKINKKYAGIMHGPYVKMLGDQILEEGIFYKGTKHGRWMRHNKYDILQEKKKWYKGWPKEAQIAYYKDTEGRRMREIIPIHYGEKEGDYYAFHKDGRIAVIGEYKHDYKVGLWREYYGERNRRKREIQYPEKPFDDEFQPFISKEWDEAGIVIYDREKEARKWQ